MTKETGQAGKQSEENEEESELTPEHEAGYRRLQAQRRAELIALGLITLPAEDDGKEVNESSDLKCKIGKQGA